MLTYADYAAIPDDGRRYELHDGELSVTPAPGLTHQGILRDLLVILDRHVKQHGLGVVFPASVDCILSDTTVLQPDLVFIERARTQIMTERAIEGAPTLAVEIISPSSGPTDRMVKTRLYARHGVPHYWIIAPQARTIDALTLAAGAYTIAGRLDATARRALPPFDDLTIDPASLFA